MFSDGIESLDQLENLPRLYAILNILSYVGSHASNHHLKLRDIGPASLGAKSLHG
jgi:hypothetical protein